MRMLALVEKIAIRPALRTLHTPPPNLTSLLSPFDTPLPTPSPPPSLLSQPSHPSILPSTPEGEGAALQGQPFHHSSHSTLVECLGILRGEEEGGRVGGWRPSSSSYA